MNGDTSNSSSTAILSIEILNEKIKYLQDELVQTQADKDFVWSLWRQLQSTNPDLTNAISLVIKREKEKQEKKDEKLLKILDQKDRKLTELMNLVIEKNSDIKELSERLARHDMDMNEKNEKISYLNLNIKTFEDKTLMFEQMMRKQEEMYENLIRTSEIDKKQMMAKLNQFNSKCAIHEQNEINMNNEKQIYETKLFHYEQELLKQKQINESLMRDFNDLKVRYEKNEINLKIKNEQYEKINEKFHDLLNKNNTNVDYMTQQEQIIVQLKHIQNELQKTLHNQDKSTNSQINILQDMYAETCKKLEENVLQQNQLKANLNEKIRLIKQLEVELQKTYGGSTSSTTTATAAFKIASQDTEDDITESNSKEIVLKHELKQLKLQNDILKQQLLDKNTIINDLNQQKSAKKNIRPRQSFSASNTRNSRSKSLENSEKQRRNSIKSDTESLTSNNVISKSTLNLLKRKLDYYKNLYEIKLKELETIEGAHKRRLDRVNYLQKQYNLMKQHLKSYVEEKNEDLQFNKNKKDIEKKVSFSTDASFFNASKYDYLNLSSNPQQNNVWNELTIFKHENRRLMQENLKLEEEVDLQKVKIEKQNSLIGELKTELKFKLDELKVENELLLEEKVKLIEKLNEDLDKKSSYCASIDKQVKKLQQKNDELVQDRIKFSEICSQLTEENNRLYKKWATIKKNENKLKLSIEQLKRANKSHSALKRKVSKKKRNKNGLVNKSDYDSAGDNTNSECEEDYEETEAIDTENEIRDENNEDDVDEEDAPSRSYNDKKGSYATKCLNLLNNSSRLIKSSKKAEISSKTKDNLLLSIKNLKRKLYFMTNKVNLLKEIEIKFKDLKAEHLTLSNDYAALSEKFKLMKASNESFVTEISCLRRRESDLKEKYEKFRKEDKEADEEARKSLDIRVKTLSQDLNKQLALNKTIKSELEKQNDKLKLSEEKLNHFERDNTQKKQLIEFYKKKLDDEKLCAEKLQPQTQELEELKQQVLKANELNEKSKVQIQSLKTRLQVIQSEKQAYEAKWGENEKKMEDLNQKYETLKKQKKFFEDRFKESKTQVNELNNLVKEVECDIETKMKHLANSNEQSLDKVETRLKEAYKLIYHYELIITKLYELLINRNLIIREKLFQNQLASDRKRYEKEQIELNNKKLKLNQAATAAAAASRAVDSNGNLKNAMNLASTVLNLTVSELEDILSTDSNSSMIELEQKQLQQQQEQLSSIDFTRQHKEFEEAMKMLYSKWINEFESVKRNDKIVTDFNANNLFELISEKLNDLINIEKQLTLTSNKI